MEENNSSDFTLYILLSVSGILVVINGIELFQMLNSWQYSYLVLPELFEKCIKSELISKTIFSIFSFLAAFSAVILTLSLLMGQQIFLDKFLKLYLHTNYIIFGPNLLGVSILGLFYWGETVHICNKNNINKKDFSISNAITVIACFVVGLFITCIVEFMESFNFVLESILKRESGSNIIGIIFWSTVLNRGNSLRTNTMNVVNENQSNLNNNANQMNNQTNILIDNNSDNNDVNNLNSQNLNFKNEEKKIDISEINSNILVNNFENKRNFINENEENFTLMNLNSNKNTENNTLINKENNV